MTEGPYLAPYHPNDALADDEVQAMARRQFAVSLVVGLALLIAAVAIEGRAAQVAPAELAAQERTLQPEARHFEIGQPIFGTKHAARAVSESSIFRD
jgi:hypothetical protein